MKLNPDNDVYTGDLSILNIRKQAWINADTRTKIYKKLTPVVLLIGLLCIIIVGLKFGNGDTMAERLPLHISIWITALVAYLVARQGKVIAARPFSGFHSARFEADDDTLYYVYQQGMSLRTYYIKDDDIQRIYRDDEAGVLLIEGNATINIQRRKSETEEHVSSFYALVPFDKYDLDDLLKPYLKKVKKADGKLKERYMNEES